MKKFDFTAIKKDLSVARHFLSLTHKISKSYIPLVILAAVIKALSPFINIIMPKFIIDELMGQKRIGVFFALVLVIGAGNALLNLINRFFDTKMDIANVALINGFELHLGKHIMDMDFENLEDPEVLTKKEQALFPLNNQGAMWRMIGSMTSLFQTGITIVGLIAIVSTLNVFLIAVIVAVVIVNSFIFKKSQATQFQFHQGLIPLNRRFGYYIELTSDFSRAKDIRLYDMSPYILSKVDDFSQKSMDRFGKLFNLMGKYEGLSNANLQLQMLIVYAYMVWRVFVGTIGIGDFTMYISAANSFSSNVSAFLTQFIEFRQMCRYLDLYVQFESIPRRMDTGSRQITDIGNIKDANITIEFCNVWFKYPRADEYTLKNVSIVIKNGERLSVVGQNGAGKTTFIKLLSRLYYPDKGEILLNGVNINEYAFEEYIKLLSVVFQDYRLFSFTIRENMCFDKISDDDVVAHALKKAGISEKINTLEKGINTSLYKNFAKDGIELSGGEMQKLAIARAICKSALIVVLDEPTAALDPYAEYEIYSKFNELVSGKTAIYISHRLSSCRFSDKIAVFDRGELIEYGTHDILAASGGKYSEMWNAQAKYYI